MLRSFRNLIPTAALPDDDQTARVVVVLAFAVSAVGDAILFAGNLRTMADQEARVAGELVTCLRNDLNDEFLGDDFATGAIGVKAIGLIEFQHYALGGRGAGGLESLEGLLLVFFDVCPEFVVIGCHLFICLFR